MAISAQIRSVIMEQIISMLKQGNDKLRKIMDQLETLTVRNDPRYDEFFTNFKEAFTKHDDIEEEILYPALDKFPDQDLNPLILKGEEAHHLIKVGMMELRLVPFASERWLPKFSVLHDAILNHLNEEENKLFPQVAKLEDQSILEDLDQKILKYLNQTNAPIPTPTQMQIFV